MSTMNRRNAILGGLGLALVAAVGAGYAFTGSSSSTAGTEYKVMSVAEMEANGGLVVDIRTPPEWAETGVIAGALPVTFNPQDPAGFLAQIGPEIADGRDLILICRSGNRSGVAAQMLESMIPNHIISVDGGMGQVIAGGYQTVPVR